MGATRACSVRCSDAIASRAGSARALQAKTALAESPASKFLQEAAELLQLQRLDQFLTRMLAQLELVFTKSTSSGEQTLRGRRVRPLHVPLLSLRAHHHCLRRGRVRVQRAGARRHAPHA